MAVNCHEMGSAAYAAWMLGNLFIEDQKNYLNQFGDTTFLDILCRQPLVSDIGPVHHFPSLLLPATISEWVFFTSSSFSPLIKATACGRMGSSTSKHSRTAFGEPGRLMIRHCSKTP